MTLTRFKIVDDKLCVCPQCKMIQLKNEPLENVEDAETKEKQTTVFINKEQLEGDEKRFVMSKIGSGKIEEAWCPTCYKKAKDPTVRSSNILEQINVQAYFFHNPKGFIVGCPSVECDNFLMKNGDKTKWEPKNSLKSYQVAYVNSMIKAGKIFGEHCPSCTERLCANPDKPPKCDFKK